MKIILPMPEEAFLKLPVIVLKGLQGNAETHYSALQRFLYPYLESMQVFWWCVYFLVLAFLTVRYFVLPLLKQARGNAMDLSCPVFVTEDMTLQNNASQKPVSKLKAYYTKLFSLREIEQDVALRLFGGAILLGLLSSFDQWQLNSVTTIDAIQYNNFLCWPVFKNCGEFIWMETLPRGYSQSIFYMIMFGVIVLCAYGLLARHIVLAHSCIFILFVFRLMMTAVAFNYNANYDYYINIFCFVFLFLPQKRFFGGLIIIWFYFLSTATKIHPSWVWGGYFNALKTGLPLIPQGLEALATNFIILMEMVMAWFLLSRNVVLQRVVFAFFCFFHVYSGILVGYHYPTIVMPSLLIFFGPLFRPFKGVPLSKNALPGWVMIAIVFLLQMANQALPGDTKLTLQANYYGPYMFESNHQCRVTFQDEQGSVIQENDYVNARFRCDPWDFMFKAHNRYCIRSPQPKIRFKEIHSINGGPFYEIVNEPDLCSLRYNAYGANDWIKNETNAPIVGRPVQNFYR